jgi:hypothetical protein
MLSFQAHVKGDLLPEKCARDLSKRTENKRGNFHRSREENFINDCKQRHILNTDSELHVEDMVI